MSGLLAFDIETIPQVAALAMTYPLDRQPPANYKSEDAITKWRATDEATWREGRVKECSLNPRLGRIVALSVRSAQLRFVDVAQTAADERALLEAFWHRARSAGVLAGWNSHGFDFPFVLTRSALLGVRPMLDVAPYLRRYSYTPHFDVKAALLQWDVRRTGEGLSEWAAAFGTPGVKTSDGSAVAGMVDRGEWDALVEYAQQDADLTFALAERCAPYFGVTP